MIHRFGYAPGSSDAVTPGSTYADSRPDAQADNPLYRVQDVDSKDVALAIKTAREMIRVSGASVLFHARTRNADVDTVFDEDPDPTYWDAIGLRAYFVPKPTEFELTEWGVDVPNTTEVVFYRGDLFENFGERLAQPGDIIELPYGSVGEHKPNYFRVDNAQQDGNFRYQWLYVRCHCTLLTGDVNIRPVGAAPLPSRDS